jgi:cystathionine beta-lyase
MSSSLAIPVALPMLMADNRDLNRRSFLRSAQMTALAGLAPAATLSTEYDFDTPYNRVGSDCIKWDAQIARYGKTNIVAGMGIADMDFRAAPAITQGLAKRMQHENWGYLAMPRTFPEAIIGWNKRRYGIDIHPDRLVLSTGVHPSIVSALRAFAPRGSKVLLLTPTYDGFFGDIAAAGCIPEESPLKLAQGRYAMDLEELDRHISAEIKTVILCNPQNPTGNCWSPEDLTAFGELCTRRGVVVLADEIHCDFVTKGNKYTPYSTLSNREIVNNSITFKSASKSFSLSAMKCGWMFSDNAEYLAKILATGHSQDFNTLGMIASLAAYTEGEDWLNQLLVYIDGNHAFAETFIRANMPLVRYEKAQGTYLAWLDVSGVAERIGGGDTKMVEQFFVKHAKVQINSGLAYGRAGAGHMRMNIATSRKALELALNNMAEALKRA